MSNNPRAPASRTADTSKTTVTPRFIPHIKFHIRAAPVRRHPRSTVPRPFRRRSARSPTNHPAKRIPRQKPRHIALRSRAASGAAYCPPQKQPRHRRLLARPAGRRFVCAYRLDKVPNSIIQSGGISTGRHIRHRFLAHMHGRSASSFPLNFHSKSECEADCSPSMKDPV